MGTNTEEMQVWLGEGRPSIGLGKSILLVTGDESHLVCSKVAK